MPDVAISLIDREIPTGTSALGMTEEFEIIFRFPEDGEWRSR